MKTELVDIETLTPDPFNARKHDEKNLSAIRGSIKQFGMVEPLVVRRQNNVVIGGNGRLEALKAMGIKQAPVHFVDLDESKSKALALALNKTAELAVWDDEILKKTLTALLDEGIEIEEFGFDIDDVAPATLGGQEQNEKNAVECPKCGHEFNT